VISTKFWESSSPRLNSGESSSPRFNSGESSSLRWPRAVSVLFDRRNYRTFPPFFVTTIHTELRCRRFAVACPPSPVMDYAWCFGSGDWAQTQSEYVESIWPRCTFIYALCLSPTSTGGFFDENINHLPWNSSTCNTPAPLVPDSTPFTFGLEMGLTNELPFSDGFSYAPCDLDSLFGHEMLP
jgi:hypothetical protein